MVEGTIAARVKVRQTVCSTVGDDVVQYMILEHLPFALKKVK